MADDVGVDPTASYTVAADVSGTVAYQRVKIQLGADGTFSGDVGPTNPVPITGAVGVSGAVSISVMPAVSGTVTVNGTVTIQPTVLTVNTAGTIAGASVTIQQGASVSAVVSGTVSVSGAVQVSGAVSISVMPAVSISVSAALGTIITILGTQVVSVVPGLSVSAVVSGTITVPLATTTAAPSVSATGQVIWVVGGQGTTASPVFVSQINAPAGAGSVTTTMFAAGGTGLAVWLGTNQTINVDLDPYETTDVPNISSTGVVVRQIGFVQTTASPGAAATGQIVWMANPVAFTVSATVTVTVTNTVTVTVTSPAVTAINIAYSSVSMATVFSNIIFTVAVNATTVATSEYIVPGGKTLRLYAIAVQCQNTAASVGVVNAIVQVQYSTAAFTVTGAVIAQAYAAAYTSATNAGGANMVELGGMDIPAGATVKFLPRVTGGTGHILQANLMGILYP